MGVSREVPSYWDYLRLDQLLDLQHGLQDSESELMPDELHFIVVHQVFELWFKLMLRELRLARDHLAAPRVPEEQVPYVVHHLRRIHRILELCVDQFSVMETLTPQDFLDFRDKLMPASGFQSFQMREIEILLGLEATARDNADLGDPIGAIRAQAKVSTAGQSAWSRIEQALSEQSLRDALHHWLLRTPIQGSSPANDGDDEVVDGFIKDYIAAVDAHAAVQIERFVEIGTMSRDAAERRFATTRQQAHDFLGATDVPEADRRQRCRIRAALLFIESYRELPLLAWPRVLIDAIVELEEQLVLWRTRHARMVERLIGRRVGTGGSAGVDYLDKTTRYRIFTDLWGVRTLLLPRSALPELRQPEAYGFAQ